MSSKIKLMMFILVAVLSVTACSRDKDKAKQAVPVEAAKKEVVPEPPPPPILPVNGKVLEILDTGSFIYVQLDWNGKKVWAAVPGVELKVGEVISLDHATMFPNFRSTALNRTFDELIFASAVVGKAPRSRVANNANSKDPRNRRSGKIAATPTPAPPMPTGKVAGKAGQ